MKLVKPSELSLDLISPSSNLRNMGMKRGGHSGTGGISGIHNQTTLAGGSPNSGTGNQNMKNILQNFRTPQNMNGGINHQALSMYGSNP